jgi:preprotein translocase subunit SecE
MNEKEDMRMSKNLAQFFRETRQEALKVTWPSRKETTTTTIVVFIMIFIMSMILLLADGLIAAGVKFILTLGA